MNSTVPFGFSEFTTWPWSFQKDLERYAAHGAGVMEVCEFKLPHNDYRPLELLPQHNLRPSSIQMKVHSVFVDSMATTPEDPSDRIAAMKEAIAGSAPFLPARTPFIVITGIPPDRNIRRSVERTVEALKELGECAASYGMTIAFEPLNPVNLHTDTAVWSLDQGLDIVQRANHPSVGICIDSWNVWQTPDLEDVIAQCGDRISIVQLSDWKTPRSTADRYALGEGTIPLARMMRSIRATRYEGPWVVEILSSMHLPGSLWKSDLDDLLASNRETFFKLWAQSAP